MNESARRVPSRTWPGTLALALAIGGYVGGLTWWNDHASGIRTLPAGSTLQIGPARFVSAQGWERDVASSRAGNTLKLFKGSHQFLVTANRWDGDAASALSFQRRLFEWGQAIRLDGEVTDFFTSWGLQGKTFAYAGTNFSGRIWQVVEVKRKLLVQIDFFGGEDGLGDSLTEARAMLDSMDLSAPN